MAEPKTKATKASVPEFIKNVSGEQKRKDASMLLSLFKKITGEKPVLWGTSIIGFGVYHYRSERSSQQGDWPLIGFSPRKQNLTLYIMSGFEEQEDLLSKLGKHKRSVGCLYVNKLSDIDHEILEKIISRSYNFMKKKYRTQ